MNENLHRVIGIDLGTTYSAVAAFNTFTEQTVIIRNVADGNSQTTPSVVSYDQISGKAIVGEWAKRNIVNEPSNTIIEIKREMGEEFSEETLKKFNVPPGVYRVGDPVKVHFAGQWLMPQEISAFILMKMKQIAEKEIGTTIHDAVVTVPAYFKEKQKSATKEAALLAGLYPHQLIPEPTAAAICYGVDRMEEEKKTYLIYDLGGGTFDVSIIQVEGIKIDVIATSGNPRLGGGDFDDAITNWILEQLRQQYKIDVSNDRSARALIKLEAEQAKIRVSTYPETLVNLLSLFPQNPPIITLTRQKVEELIDGYLENSLTFVDEAINLAGKNGVTRENIDAILLVGGSSKIPKVKLRLLDYFQKDEKFLRADADPDAVVARGAAILAKQFAPSHNFDIRRPIDSTLVSSSADDQLQIRLITEHSLGVRVQTEDSAYRVSRIVERGTNIPVTVTRGGYINPENATMIEAQIYQGEGDFIQECTLIGTISWDIEPRPAGYHKFEVTFELDINGILHVTIYHLNTGKPYKGDFNQKTAIGGVDALSAIRDKLLRMYGEVPLSNVQPPPPPGPVSQTVSSSTTEANVQHSQSAVPPPPGPVSQTVTAPRPTDQNQQQYTLVEPKVEIPDQFKTTLRRSLRQIERQYNQKLVEAYNAFITALNEGKLKDELIDFEDDLLDVYEDVRKQNS